MSDDLKRAAQALVDAVRPCPGMESIGLSYIPPDALAALRAALASPAPSPSTAADYCIECNAGMCEHIQAALFRFQALAAPSPSRDAARDQHRSPLGYCDEAPSWLHAQDGSCVAWRPAQGNGR